VAITANIQVPSKGNSVTATQNTQSVSVQQNAPNQISVLDRQSIAGIQGAADKHKTLSLNINQWVAVGNEHEVTLVHGLGKKPSVACVDSFNQILQPEVVYIDDNSVKLIVRAQFSGKIHFN
jgi:hypothetical protein